jgi:hypothetical protein
LLDRRDRASPGNQEDLMPLRDRILDEGVSRAEIEQIILVDAGWHDQKRCLLDLRRLGGVLDQLNQLVLEDDRSGRYRQIAADFEGGFVDPGDTPLLQILDQVLHSGHQAARTRLDRRSNDFRVGRREIGRAHRIDELPRVEAKLQLRFFVDLGFVDELGQLL